MLSFIFIVSQGRLLFAIIAFLIVALLVYIVYEWYPLVHFFELYHLN